MYFCIVFYLLYVKLEEQYGLARHAMSIYERATSALPDGEKLEVHVHRITEVLLSLTQKAILICYN